MVKCDNVELKNALGYVCKVLKFILKMIKEKQIYNGKKYCMKRNKCFTIDSPSRNHQ